MTSKIIVLPLIIIGITNFQSVRSDGASHHHHDHGTSNTHHHDHGASNSLHHNHADLSNSHSHHSTIHSQSTYQAPGNHLNGINDGVSSYKSPTQTYNIPSASHTPHNYHQSSNHAVPSISHHHYEEHQSPDNSIIGFFRRLTGGFVALKGGLIKGHAAFWDSKGNALINVGKRIAGRPPYGPEFKPVENKPVPYHPQQ